MDATSDAGNGLSFEGIIEENTAKKSVLVKGLMTEISEAGSEEENEVSKFQKEKLRKLKQALKQDDGTFQEAMKEYEEAKGKIQETATPNLTETDDMGLSFSLQVKKPAAKTALDEKFEEEVSKIPSMYTARYRHLHDTIKNYSAMKAELRSKKRDLLVKVSNGETVDQEAVQKMIDEVYVKHLDFVSRYALKNVTKEQKEELSKTVPSDTPFQQVDFEFKAALAALQEELGKYEKEMDEME